MLFYQGGKVEMNWLRRDRRNANFSPTWEISAAKKKRLVPQ
jgi:hypothetical protein